MHLEQLAAFEGELAVFRCRPATLVADVVLMGFGRDLAETAHSIEALAAGPHPHKAYPNARLAFELAQNMVVLATHEDYRSAGARAWVYFEHRDANWKSAMTGRSGAPQPLTPDQWLGNRVNELARVVTQLSGKSDQTLTEALAQVRASQREKPDNWLHAHLAERQSQAYELFARDTGGSASSESLKINRSLYRTLCRETHAHPRLDSFGLVGTSADGYKLNVAPRDLDVARRVVLKSTDISLTESAAALRWQRTGSV